jgi:Integrase core domain
MNAVMERWIGTAAANCSTAPSSGTCPTCAVFCATTKPNTTPTAHTWHWPARHQTSPYARSRRSRRLPRTKTRPSRRCDPRVSASRMTSADAIFRKHRVVQQACNLVMDLEDAAVSAKFLIHDRDASFSGAFDQVLADAGIEVIRSAVRTPRMNSIMKRWFRSLRVELTDRTLIWNIPHLLRLLHGYAAFYNEHRPRRARGQAAPLRPQPDNVIDLESLRVQRRDRAGGSSMNTGTSHR